jgi:putative CocE/NonD family hydrolase
MELTSLWVRWFDTWLKDKDVGLQDVPKVQVFVTGINEWHGYRSWPPLDAQTLSLYLDSSDKLQGLQRFGRLVKSPAFSAEADTYLYNPASVRAHPFPGTTTMSDNDLKKIGGGLLYQTNPLEESIVLAGPSQVDLYFSTTGRDTDFFATIVDIDPDNRIRMVTNPGLMRMRYLSGWDNPSLLEPGKVYLAKIVMKPFAHYFDKGHRIGLHLRSDWFPPYERNLNTGERIKDATRMVAVQQSIYHNKLHPSALHLKELPFRRRNQ